VHAHEHAGGVVVLGVDVVVGEELAGHGRLDQDLLVVLDDAYKFL
jgi:hypothetical protein